MMERTILSAICVRPFRCVDCGERFFRWSVRKNVALGQTGTPHRPESNGTEKGREEETVPLNLNFSQKHS
jgi:hypothetical protein